MYFYEEKPMNVINIVKEDTIADKRIVTYLTEAGNYYTTVVENEISEADYDNVKSLLQEFGQYMSTRKSYDYENCCRLLSQMKSIYKISEYLRYKCYTEGEISKQDKLILKQIDISSLEIMNIVYYGSRFTKAKGKLVTEIDGKSSSIQKYSELCTISAMLQGEVNVTSLGMIASIYGDDIFHQCLSSEESVKRTKKL